MRRRGLLACAAIAWLGCAPLDAPAPPPASTRAGAVRPSVLRGQAALALRLGPDRRVLDALTELEIVLAHASRATAAKVDVRADARGGLAVWVGDDALGVWPSGASFDDALALLDRRAATLLRAHPVLDDARLVAASAPDDSFDALRSASARLRAAPTLDAAKASAHSATALVASISDAGRATSTLQARALALHAILRARAPDEAALDRPRLARALGYAAEGTAFTSPVVRDGQVSTRPATTSARLATAAVPDRSTIARASLALCVLEAARDAGDDRARRVRWDDAGGAEKGAAALLSVPNVVYGWLGLQPAAALARFEIDLPKAFAGDPDSELLRAALRALVDTALLALAEDAPELRGVPRPALLRARDRLAGAGAPSSDARAAADEASASAPGFELALLAATAHHRALTPEERPGIPLALAAADDRPAHRALRDALVRDALEGRTPGAARRSPIAARSPRSASIWRRSAPSTRGTIVGSWRSVRPSARATWPSSGSCCVRPPRRASETRARESGSRESCRASGGTTARSRRSCST